MLHNCKQAHELDNVVFSYEMSPLLDYYHEKKNTSWVVANRVKA